MHLFSTLCSVNRGDSLRSGEIIYTREIGRCCGIIQGYPPEGQWSNTCQHTTHRKLTSQNSIATLPGLSPIATCALSLFLPAPNYFWHPLLKMLFIPLGHPMCSLPGMFFFLFPHLVDSYSSPEPASFLGFSPNSCVSWLALP